jgi:hypothetical protein
VHRTHQSTTYRDPTIRHLEGRGRRRFIDAIYSTTQRSIGRKSEKKRRFKKNSYDNSYTISTPDTHSGASMRKRYSFRRRHHITTKSPSVLRYTLILLKARPTPSDIITLSVYAEARSAQSPFAEQYFDIPSLPQQRKTNNSPPPPYFA